MARLIRGLFGQLRATAIGFSAIDAVFFVILYVLGSYFIIDAPLHFLIFALYLWLFTAAGPRARRIATIVLLGFTLALALTGLGIALVPRISPLSLKLRLFHQIFSRYYMLLALPYLILHVQSDLGGRGIGFRALALGSWVALKAAMWIVAIPALLTIKGFLVPAHAKLMAVAIPLVGLHIYLARRPERAPKPFAVGAVMDARAYRAALLGGVVCVAAVAALPMASQWPYRGSSDYMVRDVVADFEPSLARTRSGVALKPEFLAESNTCGVADCHPNLYDEWLRSAHHETLRAPYRAELEDLVRAEGVVAARLCAGCHDPISLLSGSIVPGEELHAPEALREGISCIVCHGLAAAPGSSGNGSLLYRFPEHYYRGPIQLQTLIGTWSQHRDDLHPEELRDDRPCMACHHFRELTGPEAQRLQPWLDRPHHDQPRMTEACRGSGECRSCHMPRIVSSEKPGPDLPSHGFAAVAAMPSEAEGEIRED